MKDRAFAAAYAEARGVIDSTDALIRMLDEARVLVGVSKEDLARQIEARPEIVRRSFTSKRADPTLATVLLAAEAANLGVVAGGQYGPERLVLAGDESRVQVPVAKT